MSSCSPFSINFSGSAQDLFNKVSLLIHQHGGNIAGNPSGGSFSVKASIFGTVAGTFAVSGQTCTIHITQRPFLLSCGTIESFIRSKIPHVSTTELVTLVALNRGCKPFDVTFSGSAQDLFNKVSLLIHQHGGNITGGASGGSFHVKVPILGTVAGTFAVSGQTCTIHITQRPFLLSCGTIESFVKSKISAIPSYSIAELV